TWGPPLDESPLCAFGGQIFRGIGLNVGLPDGRGDEQYGLGYSFAHSRRDGSEAAFAVETYSARTKDDQIDVVLRGVVDDGARDVLPLEHDMFDVDTGPGSCLLAELFEATLDLPCQNGAALRPGGRLVDVQRDELRPFGGG